MDNKGVRWGVILIVLGVLVGLYCYFTGAVFGDEASTYSLIFGDIIIGVLSIVIAKTRFK